jgi:hypothetical protein
MAVSVVGLVGVVACTFSARLGGGTGDDDDAMPMCGGMTCNWGCIENRCAIVAPAGGGVTPMDTKPETLAALGDLVLPAGTTINGTSGKISDVTAGFTFEPRVGGKIGVFRMKSLTINGPVKLEGAAAIAIVADGPIVVTGVVEAKGACGSNDLATLPGPGGFAGGLAAGANAVGPGSGGGAVLKAGAGGGGNGTRGGDGGTGPSSAAGGAGGAIASTPTIDMLFGGGGGGATDGGGGRGRGGGGGGAVQLVSNTKITIVIGGIDAGGCPGDSGQGAGEDGGGGGGAGGTILLEAPIIDGAGVRLAVNGGGGGAGDDNTSPTGGKSTLDRTQAPGASSTATGGGGGSGGAGAAPAVKGDDDPATHAGGGGGGIGRIRFNTRDGTIGFTGVASPALGDPASTCTAGPASVQ